MAKRRVEEDSDIDVSSTESESENEQTEQIDEEIVNVDFDYFDLNPKVDFHATKTFLTQLLGDDASEVDISGLADLILAENSVGTTIKTEGQESDPFALLSVINVNNNLTNSSIKKLTAYILEKTKKQTEFNLVLRKLLGKESPAKVGLIVSERMINMPVEVVPPMYKMLLEEMEKAENANEKYEFDYFLVVSKVYNIVAAKEEEAQKSKKKKATEPQYQMDYFHHEDIILEENAKYYGVYDYTNVKQDTDSRRVFTEYGIDPKLSLILIEKDQLAKSVPEMEEKFPPF